MRIFLIGYMGSGKSTIGKQLAPMLDLEFIDLDRYIENRWFRPIPQIFKEDGEEGFRKIEQKALTEVSEFENVVIATGGGAPCFFNNMELMNETGTTVYLAPDNNTLTERLLQSKSERPLIKGKSKEELRSFITETIKLRELFYNKSKIIIRANNELSPNHIISALAN
jgi:shikimate kinase